MDDASLDEFFDSAAESEGDRDERDVESESPREGEPDIEPATSTSRWHPGEATCEQCETGGKRLWADDGAFVCRNCKGW